MFTTQVAYQKYNYFKLINNKLFTYINKMKDASILTTIIPVGNLHVLELVSYITINLKFLYKNRSKNK